MSNEEVIRPLSLVEGIRRRPAMYVVNTEAIGLHALAYEILEDSVAEIASGFGTRVTVTLHDDGSIEVEDDGRPIAKRRVSENGDKTLLETAFTKFDVIFAPSPRGMRIWRIRGGGSHGIGFVVVNALSEWLVVYVGDGMTTSQLRFARGLVAEDLRQTPSNWSGCRFHFKPDPEVFRSIEFSLDLLRSRLRDLAALVSLARIELVDRRHNTSEVFSFPDGTSGLVQLLNCNQSPCYEQPISFTHATDIFRLDVAFQHSHATRSQVSTFVNAIQTIEGGSHWTGFKSGLTRAVNQSLRDLGRTPVSNGSALLNGLTACVAIWVDDPTFEGPTRTRFQYAAIEGTVESLVYHAVKDYLSKHPSVLEAIVIRTRSKNLSNRRT